MTKIKSILAMFVAACAASGCAVYERPVVVTQPYYAQAPVYVQADPQAVYVVSQPVYVVPQAVYAYPPVRLGFGLNYRSGYRHGWYGRGRRHY
jgi:hypothetical protein